MGVPTTDLKRGFYVVSISGHKKDEFETASYFHSAVAEDLNLPLYFLDDARSSATSFSSYAYCPYRSSYLDRIGRFNSYFAADDVFSSFGIKPPMKVSYHQNAGESGALMYEPISFAFKDYRIHMGGGPTTLPNTTTCPFKNIFATASGSAKLTITRESIGRNTCGILLQGGGSGGGNGWINHDGGGGGGGSLFIGYFDLEKCSEVELSVPGSSGGNGAQGGSSYIKVDGTTVVSIVAGTYQAGSGNNTNRATGGSVTVTPHAALMRTLFTLKGRYGGHPQEDYGESFPETTLAKVSPDDETVKFVKRSSGNPRAGGSGGSSVFAGGPACADKRKNGTAGTYGAGGGGAGANWAGWVSWAWGNNEYTGGRGGAGVYVVGY